MIFIVLTIFITFAVSFEFNTYYYMYAIVEIKGKQYKVETNQRLFVDRLADKVDSNVEFTNVLLFSDNGKVTTGEPVLQDGCVKAKVLEHVKADKLIVFKKNRRKGYRVRRGHRQPLTQILIESINGATHPSPQGGIDGEPIKDSGETPPVS